MSFRLHQSKRRKKPLRLWTFGALVFLIAVLPCSAQSQQGYFASVDSDHDGRVSLHEFQVRMSWAFRQMDRDSNDLLSTEEQLAPNSPPLSLAELYRRLAEQFHRQDRNHDGVLSRVELLSPPA